MIAGLHGTLAGVGPDTMLIDVGGVIYRVGTSAASIGEAGEVGGRVRVHTHLFVREDQLALYGFVTELELRVFETLITVTGVGPRLGCAILSRLRPDALATAIEAEQTDLLGTVPGVGKRTAARLVMELRGKFSDLATSGAGREPLPGEDDVLAALRALGYTTTEARDAVALSKPGPDATVEARIVAALRQLAGG